jgi:uncharacterized cupin superfamily protein
VAEPEPPHPAGSHGVTVVQRDDQRPRAARVAGSTVTMSVDAAVPGADVNAGINVLAPGFEIPLHWHAVGELQYILSGTGVAIDADGRHMPVSAGTTVFSPAGRAAAHGFINTGAEPLAILFAYPSPGGEAPGLMFLDDAPK